MLNINTRKLRTNLHDFGRAVNVISTGKWLIYCIIIGIIVGLFSIVFSYLIDLIQEIVLQDMAGIPLSQGAGERISTFSEIPLGIFSFHQPWLMLFLPAFGGLCAGFIIYKFSPETEGSGTDSVIRAFHHNAGYIKGNVPFTKLLASAFTIGTGGSAGKEGPIAHIGAAIGSYVGTKLKLSVSERRMLLMAGLSAGIGAIFKAPIGGALFASEVFYRRDFESEGLVASIISAIIGYSVYTTVTGWDSIFSFQSVSFTNFYELPLFIALAFIVMVAGILYTRIFYGIKAVFSKVNVSPYLKPVLGGFLVGIIGFFFPAIFGSSYGSLQLALNGELTIDFMITLVLLKILATSFTIQSGGSGGVFAPSLVIGGLVGGVFGYGMEAVAPGLVTSPEAYVLVGMASFFSGVAKTPVSSTIMITEMSKSYGLIVPLIFASAIAYLGGQNWSIYKEQLENKLSSASYRDDFVTGVLRRLKVRSAYQKVDNIPVISHRCKAEEILNKFTQADTLILPVENDAQEIVGMISLNDIRALLRKDVAAIIIAADIMVPPKLLHLNDSFSTAFEYFRESGEPELPVLQPGAKREFIGVLSEREFLLTYERAMTKKKT